MDPSELSGLTRVSSAIIDERCDAFEAAFRADQATRIEPFLENAADSKLESALFRELITLEIELRSQSDTPVTNAELMERFPGRLDWSWSAQETEGANLRTQPIKALVKASVSGGGHRFRPDIEDYEIVREIGRGGMGIVFEAIHKPLKRKVAIKAVHPSHTADEQTLKRFLNEAESVARLQHPGIVSIFECGQTENYSYLAMQFVDGPDLQHFINESEIRHRDAATIVSQIADATHYAHERGIIHRDLKPQNILLEDNLHPVITDFGLARQDDSEQLLTVTGQILGTPAYMAPEQANGLNHLVDRRTDVYAIGGILYCLLTRRPPFSGSSIVEIVKRVVNDPPEPPRKLDRQIPVDLQVICLTCLQKDPNFRYATAAEVADDLRRYLRGQPLVARQHSIAERTVNWLQRHPLRATAVGLAILLLLSFGLSLYFRKEMIEQSNRRAMAEELAETQRELARSKELASLHQEIDRVVKEASNGWTWRATDLIRETASFRLSEDQKFRLRSRAIDCWTSFDLRPVQALPTPGQATVVDDHFVGALQFDPQGEFLAIAEGLHVTSPSIDLYRVGKWQTPERSLYFSSALNSLLSGNIAGRTRSDGFRSLCLTRDQRFLAAGTRTGTVCIFSLDSESDTPSKILPTPFDAEISKLVFSSDGKHLLAVAKGQGILHWENFVLKQTDRGHYLDVALSNDDQFIFSICDQGPLLKRLDSNQVVSVPSNEGLGNRRDRGFSTFSPDDQRIIVSTNDRVAVWEPFMGNRLWEINPRGLDTRIATKPIQWSSDGNRFAAYADSRWTIWDLVRGAPLSEVSAPNRLGTNFAYDPRERFAAVHAESQTRLFEIQPDHAMTQIGGLLQQSPNLDFDRRGEKLVVGAAQYLDERWLQLLTFDSAGLRQIDDLLARNRWYHFPYSAMAPDGDSFAFSFGDLGGLIIGADDSGVPTATALETTTGTYLPFDRLSESDEQNSEQRFSANQSALQQYSPRRLRFSCLLRVAATADQSEAIKATWQFGSESGEIWFPPGNARGGRLLLETFDSSKPVSLSELKSNELRLKFSPNVIASCCLIAVPIGEVLKKRDEMKWPTGPLRFDDDGQRLWGLIGRRYLACWDAESGDQLFAWPQNLIDQPLIYDFDLGNSWYGVCRRRGDCVFGNTETGEIKHVVQVSDQPLTGIRLSRHDSTAIVSSDDGAVHMVEMATGTKNRTIGAFGSPVSAIDLSVDERFLAVGLANGECYLCKQAGDGYKPYFVFHPSNSTIKWIKFSSSGKQLSWVAERERAATFLDLGWCFESLAQLGLE